MSDRSAVLHQYLFPKQALTNFAGWVAGKERGAVTTWIIRRFVAKYGVDMGEALESDINHYKSFNQFFTRALKPGVRPLADADLVRPYPEFITIREALKHSNPDWRPNNSVWDRLNVQAQGGAYATGVLFLMGAVCWLGVDPTKPVSE